MGESGLNRQERNGRRSKADEWKSGKADRTGRKDWEREK